MYTLIDLVIATFFDINKIIIEIGVTIIKKGIHSDNNMISFQKKLKTKLKRIRN